jgi:cysteinyl-tRNA synthetase
MLKIYNTLSRKKEDFRPRDDKKVNLFVCGPTVYDYSHIGHARTYVAFDVVAKYLKYNGFKVTYLQNITDIDDKIIQRAGERGVKPAELAKKFEEAYLKDMKALQVDSVSRYARATEHIKEIISQVERLMDQGYAYQLDDGIYYDISKFKNYGKLSRRTISQGEDAVSRIDESKEKRNRGDFCLWKFSKADGPSWPSPWGQGRPGWHIEDTAITEKFFGPQYDIHGGARDLIFPHHEAEISQMEAISGKSPLVKYWIHSGFLTVEGQKMSKSLGNFVTIGDFLKKNSARLLRLLVVKTHYRSPIDYSEKMVLQTKKELARIDEFTDKIKDLKNKDKGSISALIKQTATDFENAVDDDFNTPKAVASVFNLINKSNALISKNKLSEKDAKSILDFLQKIDTIFDFIFAKETKEKVPEEVAKLAKEREKSRQAGKWQDSDRLRDEIKKLGYTVEDTKDGPKIKKL